MDGLLDHGGRDAGAAVENERQIAGQGLDLGQTVHGQALPVIGIQAVDVADAAGEEVNAEVGDGLALVRISKLASGGNAVLDATDAADLSLDGDALAVAELHDLGGALHVDVEGGLMGAVIHDGGEAGVDGLEAVLVGAVVEVHGNRHGDVHVVNEVLDDVGDDLEAHLPLSSASGALDDDGRLQLLGSLEDGASPLEVVGVEGGNAIVTGNSGVEHVLSVNEHVVPPIGWGFHNLGYGNSPHA